VYEVCEEEMQLYLSCRNILSSYVRLSIATSAHISWHP